MGFIHFCSWEGRQLLFLILSYPQLVIGATYRLRVGADGAGGVRVVSNRGGAIGEGAGGCALVDAHPHAGQTGPGHVGCPGCVCVEGRGDQKGADRISNLSSALRTRQKEGRPRHDVPGLQRGLDLGRALGPVHAVGRGRELGLEVGEGAGERHRQRERLKVKNLGVADAHIDPQLATAAHRAALVRKDERVNGGGIEQTLGARPVDVRGGEMGRTVRSVRPWTCMRVRPE